MTKQPQKRPPFWRQDLIPHPAQMTLVAASIGYVLLMMILAGSFSNYFVRDFDSQIPFAIPIAFFLSFIAFASCCLFLALFTQKIFGPIFRLQAHLNDRLEGKNPPPIVLRKGDYLVELIDAYNKTLEKK